MRPRSAAADGSALRPRALPSDLAEDGLGHRAAAYLAVVEAADDATPAAPDADEEPQHGVQFRVVGVAGEPQADLGPLRPVALVPTGERLGPVILDRLLPSQAVPRTARCTGNGLRT